MKPTIFGREPALFLGLVNAIVGLLGAFGLGLDGSTVAEINVATMAIVSFWIRSRVSPVK